MFYWTLLLSDSRLVNETRTIGLMQVGKQANQSASAIDCAGNINFTEHRAIKSCFFSQDSKETCSLIFVSVIKNAYQENIPFVKTIFYVFIKNRISGKRTVIGTCVFYSICINLENIKKKQFWARTISATHKKRGQKNYFKKMDSSKKTTVKLSKKKTRLIP